MTNYKIKLSLLIYLFIISSCNHDNERLILNDFKGLYSIKSISSSIPIDLNNDGLQSKDYLQKIKSKHILHDGELIDYGYDNQFISNFAEARPIKYHDNYLQFLDIQFPFPMIDSISLDTDKNIKYTSSISNMSTGFIYRLTENNILIESDSFNHFEFYNIRNFEINRINKNEFEISFDYKVYDFTQKEWVITILNARYEMVEE